jgi:hypothetical protein
MKNRLINIGFVALLLMAGNGLADAFLPEVDGAPSQVSRDDLSLRLQGGIELENPSNVTAFEESSDGRGTGSVDLSQDFDVGLDYAWGSGFVMGLDFPIIFLSPGYSIHGNGWTNNINSIPGLYRISGMLTPGWRWKLGSRFLLEPCLGLGGTTGVFAGADDFISGGILVWPQIRVETLFKRWGLGFSAGCLVTHYFIPAGGWIQQNGVVSLDLYGTYHFGTSF